ncbi:Reverse transcriptase [Giardia duodenalis]|uniref:Reverse transcriptase n=1 Tax=Giardia intestinalis TaxID=5741 RepID=V6U2L7_GIAIN|nr:Reverse transcriptase [Giardia intestinalis]
MDEHIARHRPAPSSPDPCPPPGAPPTPAGPDPAARDPPPSTPPDPAYPYACKMCRARYKTERGLRAHVARLGHHPPLDDVLPRAIGVPSGAPTPAMLHLLAATFKQLAERLPPVDALARLLAICRRAPGSGRLPPAALLLRKGLLGRAWEAIVSEAAPLSRVPEPTGEERRRIIRELHPEPPTVALPETQPTLMRELKAMKAVAAGPSGLGKTHLMHLCEKADAAEILAAALASLLSDCDWGRLKPLAEFRLKLLAKPNGKWRPIAIQETLLVALHRALLRQTPALRRLPPWQLAFEPMAQVKAIAMAERLKQDHHLTTVDVRNAFNSVPHAVIIHSLHRARVPQALVAYVSSFLAARHSADLAAVPAGVPQGDPLSMALFCQSIVWPVESLLSQYKLLAYADDLIVASPPSVHADTVKRDASSALAKAGLSVELSKCTSTQLGAIAFMGTRVLRDAPFNLGEQASRALMARLDVLRAARLSRHDCLRLLAACVVPSVNYGPLIDAYPGSHSYADVDRMVIGEVAEPTARALALAPRAAHGLGLVLPSHYHADMQAQRNTMRAGTFRDLRRKRLACTPPLRGLPLSDGEVLFIGECLAGHYQKGAVMGTCMHCKQPMRPRHHLLCKAINGIHVARHTRILSALVSAARGRPGYVSINPAVPVDHLQPDLAIGDLVVAVPWRLEKSYTLKLTKYRPLVAAGRASHILPVVVGADGSLHPESAAGLAHAGVDLLKFLHEAALAILWHHTHSATAFAALTMPEASSTIQEAQGDPSRRVPAAPPPPVQHPSSPGPLHAPSRAQKHAGHGSDHREPAPPRHTSPRARRAWRSSSSLAGLAPQTIPGASRGRGPRRPRPSGTRGTPRSSRTRRGQNLCGRRCPPSSGV